MNPPPLPFARLELVDDLTPRDAAMNMAVDEVLLEGLGRDPILRIYRWERRSVSIGYFEKSESVKQGWPGHDIIRRWTGGGIVEHGDDLTFSLFVPRSLLLASLPATESYRVIHAALADTLLQEGCSGEAIKMASLTPNGAGSHACFERPVQHDLMLAGRKIAGGAQRRTRRGLLHQASVQTALPSDFMGVLQSAFSRNVHPRALTTADIDAAVLLVKTKYGTPAWQRRF